MPPLDQFTANSGIDNLAHVTPDQIRDHDMDEGYLPNLARNVAVNPFAR